jgi:hypothetical protein
MMKSCRILMLLNSKKYMNTLLAGVVGDVLGHDSFFPHKYGKHGEAGL